MTRRSGHINRAAERAARYRPLSGRFLSLGKAAPSPLVLGLVQRFFQADDFPIEAWVSTHMTSRMRKAMARLANEVPVLNPEAYTPGDSEPGGAAA